MAVSWNSNKYHSRGSNWFRRFGGNPPKALVERGTDENGNPFIRQVDHTVSWKGTLRRYHPRKGWKVVQAYNPHLLLNSIWVKAGFNSLY